MIKQNITIKKPKHTFEILDYYFIFLSFFKQINLSYFVFIPNSVV